MLYFICAWTFLIVACGITGTALLHTFEADFARVGDRLIAAVWLGVVVFSVLLLTASLILPLSPLLGAAISIGLCSLSLLSKSTRTEIVTFWFSWSPGLISGFVILELGVAALTTRQVTWVDTGAYHYGVIQWLSEFGAVPGLALLFANLGFTSSWFALAAPLNAGIFDSRVSAVTNGFAFLMATLHFLICLAQCFTHKAKISDWFVVIFSCVVLPFVIGTHLMSQILVSPSPDLPITFLVEVVAWTILIISSSARTSQKVNPLLDARTVPLILAAGAVTIKLIALPLLLVATLFYIFDKQSVIQVIKRLLMGSTIILLLLSPMIVSGLITSGCPLYPSSLFCLNLPWSVTPQAVKAIAENTHGWAPWYYLPASSTPGLGLLWEWLSIIMRRPVMVLLIASSVFSAIYVVRTLIAGQTHGQIWLTVLGVLGILFMIFTAPFIRFTLGYVVLIPALPVAVYCQKKLGKILLAFADTSNFSNQRRSRRFRLVVPFFLAALMAVASISDIRGQLFLPPPLRHVELVQKQVNDVTYFFPQWDSTPFSNLCWGAKLPCASQPTEDIELRDPSQGIKAGFIHKR